MGSLMAIFSILSLNLSIDLTLHIGTLWDWTTWFRHFKVVFFSVEQVQVCWILQGDPQYTFFTAGSNEETEISLVPRDRKTVVSEHFAKPAAPGFYVRSDSDSTQSRITFEELVAWNLTSECADRVEGHDRTPGEGVSLDAS